MEIIGGRGYIGKKQLNSTTVAGNPEMFDIQVNFDKPKPAKKVKPALNTSIFEE